MFFIKFLSGREGTVLNDIHHTDDARQFRGSMNSSSDSFHHTVFSPHTIVSDIRNHLFGHF